MPENTKIQNLPSNDDEYWDESEKHVNKPKLIDLCTTHTKNNWAEHRGYKDNHDGTISCKFCSWGTSLAGYYRVHEGNIVDLRDA